MGMRFRKSIKLGPGVRFNVSKTGVGISAGVKGARYSVHSSGRKTTSARLPGTGVYYMKQTGGHGSKATRKTKAAPIQPSASHASPGLFAPAYKKKFAEAVKTLSGRRYQGSACAVHRGRGARPRQQGALR